jgi:hypothetical protein
MALLILVLEKLFGTCCRTPIGDYFTNPQKMTCNNGRMDAVLFKSSKDYELNKFQNILNKLDWTLGIGKTCLLQILKTIPNMPSN